VTEASQPLDRYRIFGLLLLALFLFILAGYFVFRVGPQERNVTVAGVIVPVPNGMKKVPDSGRDVKIPGRDQEKIAFKGNVSPSMIARFYHNLMPAEDWQPDATLGSKAGGFAFTRGNQQLIINIAELEPHTSLLTIVVNPSEPFGEPPVLVG
jgi:hypothetical protein